MKISDMDEREYNRFQNLESQKDKAYANKEKSFRTEAIYKDGMSQFCKHLAVEYKINNIGVQSTIRAKVTLRKLGFHKLQYMHLWKPFYCPFLKQ